jgi:hypothetical protein
MPPKYEISQPNSASTCCSWRIMPPTSYATAASTALTAVSLGGGRRWWASATGSAVRRWSIHRRCKEGGIEGVVLLQFPGQLRGRRHVPTMAYARQAMGSIPCAAEKRDAAVVQIRLLDHPPCGAGAVCHCSTRPGAVFDTPYT